MANKRVYRTTFQFRRASARNWYRLNPTLAQGEPGYELDTGKFKIGNGITPWRKLQYVNGLSSTESGVFSADTVADFPEVGSLDIIYKANSEKALYQFNVDTSKYEPLCNFETDEDDTIIIDSELSLESENAVQNKVITAALNDKVDKVDGKGLSTNDYTDSEKLKLYQNIENLENLTIEVNTIKESVISGESIHKLDGGLI